MICNLQQEKNHLEQRNPQLVVVRTKKTTGLVQKVKQRPGGRGNTVEWIKSKIYNPVCLLVS